MTRAERHYLSAKHWRETVERYVAQGHAHAGHLNDARRVERDAKEAWQTGRIVSAIRPEDRPLLREAIDAARRARE